MTYRIEGLKRAEFASLFTMNADELAGQDALRVVADGPGFPCRVSLEDAKTGESLILLNDTSHDVATPYRSTYAIYVRENGAEGEAYIDRPPPVFAGRPLGLRAFDAGGMLCDAALALPGQADEKIRALFDNPEIAYIHAHNAAHGCFSARVERCG
jgi:Protein of unknown function (DUF1203)